MIVGRVQTFEMLNIAPKIRRIGQIFGQILKFFEGGELIDELAISLFRGKAGP